MNLTFFLILLGFFANFGHNEPTTVEHELLTGTPLVKVSDHDLCGLAKRHGPELLLHAADIAAETWRRNREDKHNPGGYLNSLCSSLIIPVWYVPVEERAAKAKELELRKKAIENEQIACRAREEAKNAAMEGLWDSLTVSQREEYRKKALVGLPNSIMPSMTVTMVLAKSLAWEEVKPCNLPVMQDHSAVENRNPCEENRAQIPALPREGEN